MTAVAESSKTSHLFAKSFWSIDDSSSDILINHFHQGNKTMEVLSQFYNERISIEEEYSRKLSMLSRKLPLAAYEASGTLKESLLSLSEETKQLSVSHAVEANKINEVLLRPLGEFLSDMKAKGKSTETNVSKLLKYKKNLERKVEQTKKKYESAWNKINSYKTEQILMDEREATLIQSKILKLQELMISHRSEYYKLVKEYNALQETWKNQWYLSCENYQSFEEDKIKFLRQNIWEYANAVSSTCLSADQSCENIRLSLESCSYRKDIPIFVQNHGTGNEIAGEMEFIDFAKGQQSSKAGSISTRKVNTEDIQIVQQQIEEHQQQLDNKRNPPPELTAEEETHFDLIDRRGETFKELQRQAQLEAQEAKSQTTHNTFSEPGSYKGLSDYSNPTSVSSYDEQDGQLTTASALKSSVQNSVYSNPLLNSITSDDKPTEPINLSRYKEKNDNLNSSTSTNPLRAYMAGTSGVKNSNMSKFRDSMMSVDSPTLGNNTSTQPKQSSYEKHIKRHSLGDLLKSSLAQKEAETQRQSKKDNISTTTPTTQTLIKEKKTRKFSDSTDLPPSSSTKPMTTHSKLEKEKQRKFSGSSIRKSKSSANLQIKHINYSNLPSRSSEGYEVVKYSRAQYHYKAEIEQELSFKKKDILMILHQQPDGWWFAENLNTGESGLAPSNYLVDL